MTIVEFNEALAVALNAQSPIESMNGSRVWVLSHSERPSAEYSWVGIASSLEEAKRMADERADRYVHGTPTDWEPYGMGMRGPSAYRRQVPDTNSYVAWQMINQAFLNGS